MSIGRLAIVRGSRKVPDSGRFDSGRDYSAFSSAAFKALMKRAASAPVTTR